MREKNGMTTGGLVLQSRELRKILKEKGCIGLAFGLFKPGFADNVNLRVYKVTHDGRQFVGDEYKIRQKKAASCVDGKIGKIDRFQFEYYSHLVNNKFDFAFLAAQDFADVWRNGEEEVFIAGGLKHFGNIGQIKGEWFTLTISPRAEVKKESPRKLSLPGQMKHLDSCPPTWSLEPSLYDGQGGGHQIRFVRSN
ncbi:MAG: hypothetical protein AAGD05_11645 [Bacteroidota bacterium]